MRAPILIFPLLLAACEETSVAPAPGAPFEQTACAPESYEQFLGRPGSAVDVPEGVRSRVIAPGDMVTMDFVATRVNFETDEDGIVRNIRCG